MISKLEIRCKEYYNSLLRNIDNWKRETGMRFYVDYDDCLCETARAFIEIAERLFGKHIPYEEIHSFNLQESFSLTEDEYKQLMDEGHRPEILLSYEQTPGASETLNAWMDQGHEVCIITGRPGSTFEESRRWLDIHGLQRAGLFFFDKYGRDTSEPHGGVKLEPEAYYQMKFDYAIEDSPKAFRFFDHLPGMKVLVFDRPWNRECAVPGTNYFRCADWEQIRKRVI